MTVVIVAPSTAKQDPISYKLILASSVVFAPRLREPERVPFSLWESRRTVGKARCWCPSRPRIRASCAGLSFRLASPSRPL